MDTLQANKVGRYLQNSSRFLWGLGPGNQAKNYAWLRSKGFEFKKGNYGDVTRELLEGYRLDKIVTDLITPQVKSMFPENAVGYLRTCWDVGTQPDISMLRAYNVQSWLPFLEINNQFNYIERWGEFAGLWFEEIEPDLGQRAQ